MYDIYINEINPARVTELNLYVSAVPQGETIDIGVGGIRALPLAEAAMDSPAVTVNGVKLTFPVRLVPGEYIEYIPGASCLLYDRSGEVKNNVPVLGVAQEFVSGENTLQFDFGAANGTRPRVKVTTILTGPTVGRFD
jgi:hypothetical protein